MVISLAIGLREMKQQQKREDILLKSNCVSFGDVTTYQHKRLLNLSRHDDGEEGVTGERRQVLAGLLFWFDVNIRQPLWFWQDQRGELATVNMNSMQGKQGIFLQLLVSFRRNSHCVMQLFLFICHRGKSFYSDVLEEKLCNLLKSALILISANTRVKRRSTCSSSHDFNPTRPHPPPS